MREVITINIGQAGCQLGNSCWELFCLEHGILPDGTPAKEGLAKNLSNGQNVDNAYNAFFNEVQSGRFVPRAIFVDTEPTVIDEIKTGNYSKLYHPRQLLSAKEDAASNFALGKNNFSPLVEETMEALRKSAEACSGLQGFFYYNSVGGGTGSGFTAALCEKIAEQYPKRTKINTVIWPSPKLSSGVVEPYNAVLNTHAMLKLADCTLMVDNESIYSICQEHLEVQSPSYSHLNQIIAQAMSSVTASLRFEGTLNVDLNEFPTNLVPFPRVHFAMMSYAPIVTPEKAQRQTLNVQELTTSLFDRKNLMIQLDEVNKGKYMSCCMMYRGDVSNREVNLAINVVKNSYGLPIADFCPCPFKCGINNQPPTAVPNSQYSATKRSACMLANHTSMCQVFGKVNQNFDQMYGRRAFIHHYAEFGMEENEFIEARQDMFDLETEYANLALDNPEVSGTMA
ncbi:tubulin alpha-1 chain, putative [Entamoeba invadens IP1]|uniref:Tubulin alpha chain n=2 Tax=Entamoeba invadens TaxID=33085 RepID=A0A0A1U6N4_ENTIV|nr:tubulin alpha-1 chain, putative [Entamoeba invadens IP1]ELP90078.1 tubulin alpha-1 chain, putative [Entamoeba invadens IP1]BAN40835.1 tubulin alpha-1 chain, putative [Entamoeba invadens]BAN41252.1 tubulin alpha-1 chain, putative [Entamoeba invadens]|eukprot:XP_004256849.1 tubulin alpha-1 chain, putative [Entamoeba invadens IP1]